MQVLAFAQNVNKEKVWKVWAATPPPAAYGVSAGSYLASNGAGQAPPPCPLPLPPTASVLASYLASFGGGGSAVPSPGPLPLRTARLE